MSFRGRGGGFRGRGGNNFFDFLILMTSLKCFITSLQSSSNFSIYIKLSTISYISYRNLMNNFVWMNPLNMSLQTICNLLSIILI